MGRRVTSPKWVTLPTWGPPPPRKQALSQNQGLRTSAENQIEFLYDYFITNKSKWYL